MKQVTLEIDDATYHSAEEKARHAGSSLPAVVIDFLRQFSAGRGESEFEQLAKQEEAIREQIRRRGVAFSGSDRLTRDELYERHAIR